MDPVQKVWMFENWQQDQCDTAELAKNHAYLLGSFWNPQAAKELMGNNNSHISSDEDFEESSNMVRDMNLNLLNKEPENNRKRRKIKR